MVNPEERPWPLGIEIKSLRTRRNWSIRDAASRAGISEATWRALESGKKSVTAGVTIDYHPGEDTLRKVAAALGTSARTIFELAAMPLPINIDEIVTVPDSRTILDEARAHLHEALELIESAQNWIDAQAPE